MTGDPEKADFVLFVESGYFGLDIYLRLHEIKKQWPAELFVFSESDWPFPVLPGLYPSLTKQVPWAHSWSFLMLDQPMVDQGERPYMFSFLGRSSTHPLRKEILKFDDDTTPCIDIAAAPQRFPDWDYGDTYARILGQSQFALCPRGYGTSSIRLFEAMRAACVPVIISDNWIEPPLGEWRNFSIRIPENRIDTIPEVCAEHSSRAREMGQLAAMTYRKYFSPDFFIDNAVDFIREHSICSPRSIAATTLRAISLREFRDIASRLKNGAMTLGRGITS